MNLGTLTAILAVVDKISPAVSGISGNVGKAMSAIKGAIAGAFAVEAVTKAISKFTEFTGRVTDTAAKLGISTTAVQKFEMAFADAGVGIDTVGNAIGEMGKRLVEGDSGAVNALGRLGLKTADLLKMAPDAAFTKIADAVAGIQNPMERATVAQDVFGKGGKEMLAALDGKLAETTQGFEDMGLVMSEELIAAGDELGDSLGHLETAGMNLLGTVLTPIIPILTQLVQWLGQVAQIASVVAKWFGQELLTAFNSAKEALFSFLSNLADTASKIPIVGSAMKGIGDAADWLKTKAIEAGTALQETYAGMRQELKDNTGPAVESVARIVGTYGENAKKVAENTKAADEATQRFRDSIKTFGITTSGYLNVVTEGVTDTKDIIDDVRQSMQAMSGITFNTTWATFKDGAASAKKDVDEIRSNMATMNSWKGVGQNVAGSIVSAVQGGGNVGQSIGTTLGNELGNKLGNKLGDMAGKAIGGKVGAMLGGAVGSVVPVVGTLIGGAVGKLAGGAIGKLFGGGAGKQANDLRDQLLATAGGIQSLSAAAQAAGTNVDALLSAKKPEQVQAAWDALNAKLGAHSQQIQLAKQAMQEFGIDASQAGQAFKQAEMDDTAKSITEKLEAMMAVGVSTDAIIAGAGDEVGAFIQRAIEMGTTVPKEWEPIAKKMIEAGTLIDANGEKFTDMSQVPFAETLNDKIGAVMDKLGQFIDRILQVPDALDRIPRNVDVNMNIRRNDGDNSFEQAPGFANGSAGVRDFRGGTWAILHGRERVQTEAQMRAEQALGGGGGAPVVNIDARGALVGDYASQMRFADLMSDAVMRRLGLRGRLNVAGAF